jgi:hypothetical protein
MRDYDDAGEFHFGVDAARQRRHRIDAGERDDEHGEDDDASVMAGEAADVHGFLAGPFAGFSPVSGWSDFSFSSAPGLVTLAFSPRP